MAVDVSPAMHVDDLDHGDKMLGERLRELRQSQGLKLKDLAQRTDMSIALISQIERGISSPSMRTLRLLCVALGVDGAALFAPNAGQGRDVDDKNEYTVRVSARSPIRLGESGVTKYRVTPASCSSLEGFLMELEAGGCSDPQFQVQSGDKIAYVVAGKLRLFVGDRIFLLEAGDVYGFSTGNTFRWENGWDQKTQFLVVNSNHFYV